MLTLKALRDRRKSVQSTQKITMAMKMVAGAKLRRAQERVEAGRPYAHAMNQMLRDLAENAHVSGTPHPLLTGTGKADTHLILIATSDQGLCGPFNSSILRESRKVIAVAQEQGQTVKLISIGRKGKDVLTREYGDLLIESFVDIGRPRLYFSDAERIAESLLHMFDDGIFDICTLVYNHFKSAIAQEVTVQQIIPIKAEESQPLTAIYEYEPHQERILSELLPQNVAVQIYNGLLENAASEQGARMTAMDNASRNADEIIRNLTLLYNRTRQSQITRELIEIISGAEALQA
jgi:F-type H+-transporting ATPase subunit gamma